MKIAMIILTVLLLLAGGGAGYFYMQANNAAPETAEEAAAVEEEEEEEEAKDPIFVKLDPPLVVNFTHRGNLRYLQTTLELMHTNQDVIDKVSSNMPVIRNNLIMVLSDQTFENLSSKTAKEDLRVKISDTISELISAEPPVEIYITSFVMQ